MQIWKYVLHIHNGPQRHDMPRGAKILSVQFQDNDLCIWVLVDPDKSLVPRIFRVAGTGWTLDFRTDDFIGTVQQPPYVWHVFETTSL